MGDHFVLLVDRLLTESTLEAALESRNRSQQQASGSPVGGEPAASSNRMEFTPGKLVECRICQDEDDDSKMETPCSCCGSLKYAHRRCVQRWCNEKGDTICEICHQPFKPGYTAPPPLFHYGGIPMNFRGNWEIPRRELYNPRFIAMVSTSRSFLDADYDDYSSPTSRSLICCRTVAIIFMVLLVLRHALPIIISGTDYYSFTMFMLLLLRICGILLPIYLAIKAVAAILRRRRQHEPRAMSYNTSGEVEQAHLQPQQHLIHVH
ncbi:hypothetical protein MKW94_018887 [Papaver nudicaule]|uniref:RING-CH-type domain-containing protein n=1 Tax=Papaver nudicaule TaxID=74823 RepID=A0AA42B4R1_PAPNU|nr:hypothetical protein [Papaver nudicaule]MCL7051373.1 hypothetical protein [Papaver nudicaule]